MSTYLLVIVILYSIYSINGVFGKLVPSKKLPALHTGIGWSKTEQYVGMINLIY